MPVEGLQELINKLEELTGDKLTKKLQKEAIEDVAKKVLEDMKVITPVSKVRTIHGIDAEGISSFSRGRSAGYKVGLSNMNGDWERVRGLWFQNFKIDEPNYGWYTNFYNQNKERYYKMCRERVKEAVARYLESL